MVLSSIPSTTLRTWFSFLSSAARRQVLSLCVVLSTIFIACGDDSAPVDEPNTDSNVVDTISNVSTTREVQTDSGKLVITHRDGMDLEDVILLDANGQIKARGQFYNNQPAGAWLKYGADGNVVTAVQFSEGIAQYNLDAEDFSTERVEMAQMGISFVKPVKWDTVSPYNPLTFVSYEKDVNEAGVIMKPNINISKGTLEAGQTLESLAAQMLNMLHQQVGRVELVDESYLTIDSCSSFRRYGMYYTEDNKIGFLDAIILKGSTIWVISCAAQNKEQGEFLKYQAVFENLVLSVEVQ